MGISHYYKEKPTEDLHGRNATQGSNDFATKKELKSSITRMFKSYQCPSCGGHKVDGEKIVVEIGKVRLFAEVQKKGLFGEKYVDKHQKDIFRVYSIQLESSGFLSFAGYLRCRSCKWEQKGGKGVRWMSMSDIAGGRF